MIYFLLPKTHCCIYKNICFKETEKHPEPVMSNSLSYYLLDIKKKINIHIEKWDMYKKYTNPYEYIHTVVPKKKKNISKYKPLSRSYFKLIEIVHHFFDDLHKKTPIKTFHLAEGPGGFIEAMLKLRNNFNDSYIGMTIQDENENVPSWKKSHSFLKENSNVFIENGKNGSGNILSVENFIYCKEKYMSSIDFITADGGFDFSVDFDNQEMNMCKLLFAQISFALCMQKKNGCFILKIFDSFNQHTVDLLYILSSFYEKVYLTKPLTSRVANSEKYVVCKNFLFHSCEDFYPYLLNCFREMMNSVFFVDRFLNIPLSCYFMCKMEEYNSIIGQQQIENIHQTLTMIENAESREKINSLIKTNVKKCIFWCSKHNIPYNNSY